jgi:serine/threonine protein phosphatase PrpC
VTANGHRGNEAPLWFVKAASSECNLLLSLQQWDFNDPEQKNKFEFMLAIIISKLDIEYCQHKLDQFKSYSLDIEAGFNAIKPLNDGCTLDINILFGGYLIHCNIGDTRTVIGATFEKELEIRHIYTSQDHDVTHQARINYICAKKGLILSKETKQLVPDESQHKRKPYPDPVEYCIFREKNPNMKDVNCLTGHTLSDSAMMGGISFKQDHCAISSKPDIQFIKIQRGVDYCVVVGTNGVWDYLNWKGDKEMQSKMVLKYIHKEIGLSGQVKNDSLTHICEKLVDRDSGIKVENKDLYVKGFQNYNNSIARIIYLKSI